MDSWPADGAARPAEPGDAWHDCRCGERHWGTFGAAGLLVVSGQDVLLQLRSAKSHRGGTWALPGGARRPGEGALAAALREGWEEAGLAAAGLRPTWWVIADHIGWTYTTVAAEAASQVACGPGNWEADRTEWAPASQVEGYDLHPGLRQMWPTLRGLIGRRSSLIVDAANVMGSTPDGWWKDRAGAARRLRQDLEPLARRGLANLAPGPPAGWYPELVLVVEGRARGIGQGQNVRVVDAPAEGDDQIVAEAARAVQAKRGPVEVATADKGLMARLKAVGAQTMRPGALLSLIR